MDTNKITSIINRILEAKPLALPFHEHIERMIIRAFNDCLAEGEICEQLQYSKGKVRPDFYVPKGCVKLGLVPETMIELKAKFNGGQFVIAKKMLDDCPNANKLIMMYFDEDDRNLPYIPRNLEFTSRRIEFVTLQSFAAKNKEFLNVLEIIANEKEIIPYEWEKERDLRVARAKQDVQSHYITLFLGAGVSMSMKMPSWNSLLEQLLAKPHHNPDMAHIKGSDIDSINEACGYSSIIAGRYATLGLADVEASIRDVIYKKISQSTSPLVESLCKAFNTDNIHSIITYNYDDIIETTLASNNIDYCTVAEMDYNYSPSKPIYHVHGFIPRDKQYPSRAILSEDRYHDIYREAFHWSNVEQLHALSRNVCFFIGLSMTDPNLRRLCDIAMRSKNSMSVQDSIKTPEPVHYAFLKRNSFKKGCDNCPDCPKNTEHFDIFEHMMNDLGIQVIWFSDYEKELPKLVKDVFGV